MPEMDGIALAECVLAEKTELKVLLLSGYYCEDERTTRLSERGAAFLKKPFSLTALLERIEGILGG
jgi:DNA-binding response OmpR family regulator